MGGIAEGLVSDPVAFTDGPAEQMVDVGLAPVETRFVVATCAAPFRAGVS